MEIIVIRITRSWFISIPEKVTHLVRCFDPKIWGNDDKASYIKEEVRRWNDKIIDFSYELAYEEEKDPTEFNKAIMNEYGNTVNIIAEKEMWLKKLELKIEEIKENS